MRRRLAIAATDRVDCPATYNRISQDSSLCGVPFFRAGGLRAAALRTSFFEEAIFFFIQQLSGLRLALFSLWHLRHVAVDFAAICHGGSIVDKFLFVFVAERNRFLHFCRVGLEFGA